MDLIRDGWMDLLEKTLLTHKLFITFYSHHGSRSNIRSQGNNSTIKQQQQQRIGRETNRQKERMRKTRIVIDRTRSDIQTQLLNLNEQIRIPARTVGPFDAAT
jgi:hypothetical protein